MRPNATACNACREKKVYEHLQLLGSLSDLIVYACISLKCVGDVHGKCARCYNVGIDRVRSQQGDLPVVLQPQPLSQYNDTSKATLTSLPSTLFPPTFFPRPHTLAAPTQDTLRLCPVNAIDRRISCSRWTTMRH